MDSRPLYIITLLVVYAVATIILILAAAKSSMPKDKKLVSYLVSIFGGPFFGLIVFLILKSNGNKNATA